MHNTAENFKHYNTWYKIARTWVGLKKKNTTILAYNVINGVTHLPIFGSTFPAAIVYLKYV